MGNRWRRVWVRLRRCQVSADSPGRRKAIRSARKGISQAEKESAAGEKGSATGGKESTTGEKMSATGEKGSATAENESATGEKESTTGKKESAAGEKESAAGEKKSAAAKKILPAEGMVWTEGEKITMTAERHLWLVRDGGGGKSRGGGKERGYPAGTPLGACACCGVLPDERVGAKPVHVSRRLLLLQTRWPVPWLSGGPCGLWQDRIPW